MSQLAKHVTLALGVLSLSPMLGVEIMVLLISALFFRQKLSHELPVQL